MPPFPRSPTLGALPLCLPAAASACVECRQAALSAVFSDGFFATLLTLWMPVGLLLAAGVLISCRPRPASRNRDAHGL